jgi:hypothetical protein
MSAKGSHEPIALHNPKLIHSTNDLSSVLRTRDIGPANGRNCKRSSAATLRLSTRARRAHCRCSINEPSE